MKTLQTTTDIEWTAYDSSTQITVFILYLCLFENEITIMTPNFLTELFAVVITIRDILHRFILRFYSPMFDNKEQDLGHIHT